MVHLRNRPPTAAYNNRGLPWNQANSSVSHRLFFWNDFGLVKTGSSSHHQQSIKGARPPAATLAGPSACLTSHLTSTLGSLATSTRSAPTVSASAGGSSVIGAPHSACHSVSNRSLITNHTAPLPATLIRFAQHSRLTVRCASLVCSSQPPPTPTTHNN
eukprot:COSAG06_NODE_13829_length_1215_cov_2.013441_1_plen_158_part_10